MRIACIHLPAFPLQVVLRHAPHRRGAAIAVVARLGVFPVVVACSRAARAAGVTVGMAAATVREVAPAVEVVTADPAAERATIKAIAEALGALTARVDAGGVPVGPHHAIYAELPARMRGATFGVRARALLEVMGASGRVGIADDRFTARVAASSGAGDVITVPRGGSAAYLAPLPLSLLAISGEVRHMLETLGVHTLGEFAALPPPSVSRPEDADWQALARGCGGAGLTLFTPSGPIVERLAVGDGGGLAAAVGDVAARVAARLVGRGQSAAAIELVLGARDASERAIEIVPDAPLAGVDELADAIGGVVGADVPTWIEARVRTMAGDGAIAAPIFAEASAPLATVAPLRLIPDVVPAWLRAPHRRTRRGKERLRVGAQRALFAGLDRT